MTKQDISPKTSHQTSPQISVRQNGPHDLLARLYREIGISAVAAALESSARKPQQPAQAKKQELPAFLRDDEAA